MASPYCHGQSLPTPLVRFSGSSHSLQPPPFDHHHHCSGGSHCPKNRSKEKDDDAKKVSQFLLPPSVASATQFLPSALLLGPGHSSPLDNGSPPVALAPSAPRFPPLLLLFPAPVFDPVRLLFRLNMTEQKVFIRSSV